MNTLQNKLNQLDKDYISYNMELCEHEENDTNPAIALSIYYDYNNQVVEFYNKNGDLI